MRRSIVATALVVALLVGVGAPARAEETGESGDRTLNGSELPPIAEDPAEDPGTAGDPIRTYFPLADPDTVAGATQYVSYGTTVNGTTDCGGSGSNNYLVPYMVHAGPGLKECVDGSALNSLGPSFDASKGVWAPSVVRYNNQWIMYFTATRAGTAGPGDAFGKKCIGYATGTTATSFTPGGIFYCPSDAERSWVIDPDAFVDGGSLYVTFRDDTLNSFPGSGLSVARANATLGMDLSTKRTLLLSSDMTWEDRTETPGVKTRLQVIENPSMMRLSNGRWYLFFSGNAWPMRRYSTGIADCGTSPLPSTRCVQRWGSSSPYFGYHGADDLDPVGSALPRNGMGPGGMSTYRTIGGGARVVWHVLFREGTHPDDTPARRSMSGVLAYSGGLTGTWSVTG